MDFEVSVLTQALTYKNELLEALNLNVNEN